MDCDREPVKSEFLCSALRQRRKCIALIFLCVITALAGCVYETAPAPVIVPSTFDRSWSAALLAAQDEGVRMALFLFAAGCAMPIGVQYVDPHVGYQPLTANILSRKMPSSSFSPAPIWNFNRPAVLPSSRLMIPDEIRDRFNSVTVWKRGGEKAPHAPLHALYAVGHARRANRLWSRTRNWGVT